MRTFKTFALTLATLVVASGGFSSGVLAGAGKHKAAKPAQAAPAEKAETPARGLLMPYINPARGRKLFASKGCVVCHSVNGIGGEDAPPLDAKYMPAIMNPFDFAAKMWSGAATMIAMQESELGEQIEFDGDELINIIAFVHDAEEQKKFSEKDIPPRIDKLMGHLGNESEEHEKKEHN